MNKENLKPETPKQPTAMHSNGAPVKKPGGKTNIGFNPNPNPKPVARKLAFF